MKPELEAVYEVFRSEAREQLDAVERGLLALEATPEDTEALQRSFRSLHTLKGSASTVGLSGIAEFAHGFEDLLEQLREGRLRVGQMVMSLLLDSVDALRCEIERRRDTPRAEDDELSRLAQRIAVVRGSSHCDSELTAQAGAGLRSQSGGRARAPDPPARVEMAQIDALLALAGSVGAAHAEFRALLRETGGPEAEKLRAAFREPARGLLELHRRIQRLRRVSIAPVLEPFVRMARDLSRSLGKPLRVDVRGDDVTVDAALVETLRTALTHLVRNAVDHGIEPPEQRAERGKSPWGSLTLRAALRSGDLVIECTDDGAGIDRAGLRERARARGLLGGSPAGEDGALDDLLFVEGFSTAPSVTELSGRGVGLGAVRSEVEALGGSVRISSVCGAGTTVSIRVPAGSSTGELLCTRAADETVLLRLDEVVDVLELPESAAGSRSGTLRVGGQPILWGHLASLLNGDRVPGDANQLVILERRGRRCGVAVEDVGSVESALTRPLVPSRFGLSAVCALRTGARGFLLDSGAILRQLGLSQADPASAAPGAGAGRRKTRP